ncbi:papain family cysteine protease, partial [Oesophagostomum dentatum]
TNAVLALVAIISLDVVAIERRPQDIPGIVDYINKKQSLFKADIPKMSYKEFKSRLIDDKYFEDERVYGDEVAFNGEIPESFDARKQWPECESIRIIRDQANCGRNYYLYWCDGGYSLKAWIYMAANGSCTGGAYGEKGVCKPYAFHPCGKHGNQTYYGECLRESEETPKCRRMCQFRYPKKYEEDKIYGE